MVEKFFSNRFTDASQGRDHEPLSVEHLKLVSSESMQIAGLNEEWNVIHCRDGSYIVGDRHGFLRLQEDAEKKELHIDEIVMSDDDHILLHSEKYGHNLQQTTTPSRFVLEILQKQGKQILSEYKKDKRYLHRVISIGCLEGTYQYIHSLLANEQGNVSLNAAQAFFSRQNFQRGLHDRALRQIQMDYPTIFTQHPLVLGAYLSSLHVVNPPYISDEQMQRLRMITDKIRRPFNKILQTMRHKHWSNMASELSDQYDWHIDISGDKAMSDYIHELASHGVHRIADIWYSYWLQKQILHPDAKKKQYGDNFWATGLKGKQLIADLGLEGVDESVEDIAQLMGVKRFKQDLLANKAYESVRDINLKLYPLNGGKGTRVKGRFNFPWAESFFRVPVGPKSTSLFLTEPISSEQRMIDVLPERRSGLLTPELERDLLDQGGVLVDSTIPIVGHPISIYEWKLRQYMVAAQQYKRLGLQEYISDFSKSAINRMLDVKSIFSNPPFSKTYRQLLAESNVSWIEPYIQQDLPVVDLETGRFGSFLSSGNHGQVETQVLSDLATAEKDPEPNTVSAIINGEGFNNSIPKEIVAQMVKEKVGITLIATHATKDSSAAGNFGIRIVDVDGVKVPVWDIIEPKQAKQAGQDTLHSWLGVDHSQLPADFQHYEMGEQLINTNTVVHNESMLVPFLRQVRALLGDEEFYKHITPDLIDNTITQDGKTYTAMEGPLVSVILKLNALVQTHKGVSALWKEMAGEHTPFLQIVHMDPEDIETYFTPIKSAFDYWMYAYSGMYEIDDETATLVKRNPKMHIPSVGDALLANPYYSDIKNLCMEVFRHADVSGLKHLEITTHLQIDGISIAEPTVPFFPEVTFADATLQDYVTIVSHYNGKVTIDRNTITLDKSDYNMPILRGVIYISPDGEIIPLESKPSLSIFIDEDGNISYGTIPHKPIEIEIADMIDAEERMRRKGVDGKKIDSDREELDDIGD